MTTSGGFEPTEAQSGVDPNMFTLIDPETIPYPLTDVWSLNYAAEKLRSGGEALAGDAEDMRSTWTGLQAHYSAPESDDLFSKMDPVVTRGEGIEADLGTVATALEDLAEAAATARRKLNTLRIEAQGFYNRNKDKKIWWLDKDDETDEFALLENIRLKDEVNTAWAAFNEAENTCATTISSVYGGAAYVAPDQARGDDVIVYGLPTDAGERDLDLSNPETAFTFAGFNAFVNDITGWAGSEFHPSMARFDSSTDQAAWDVLVVDGLWGAAVGAQSLLGFWHPNNGWRFDPEGRWENARAGWNDARLGAATVVGLYDGENWLFDPAKKDEPFRGATWAQWTTNMEAVLDEAIEGNTAWSQREEDPEYTGATTGINAVLLTAGLPIKALKTGLTLGSFGNGGGHGGSDGPGFGDDRHSPEHGRPLAGESSPWPREGEAGSAPTGERFDHGLDILRESLLDPNRYRDTPTPQPDRPSSGDGAAPTPQNQTPDAPSHRPRGEEPDAPRAPEPVTSRGDDPQRDETDAQRSEEDPVRTPEEGGEDRAQDDVRSPDRDADREDGQNPQEEPGSPEAQAGGSGGGDEQPPQSPTGTGDNAGDPDDGNSPGEPPTDDVGEPIQEAGERFLDVFPDKINLEGRVPRPDQTDPGRYHDSQVSVRDLRSDGLINENWESFEPKEREVAQFLSDHGIEVQSVTESTVDGRRTPDAVISGTDSTIEFKILESASPRAIEANIRKGRKQSSRIALDVRGPQIDSEVILASLGRTLKTNGGDLEELIIIGDGYVIVWP
ncbi:CdiA C-terminal domain-containing protein [Nocardiopsis changdeensis]|uniref:CdiA C-terminal domain-containing protein n=1 Tax=Nocardiopsis changdeensis TaxID=2831969 RepID=UPI003F4565B2